MNVVVLCASTRSCSNKRKRLSLVIFDCNDFTTTNITTCTLLSASNCLLLLSCYYESKLEKIPSDGVFVYVSCVYVCGGGGKKNKFDAGSI